MIMSLILIPVAGGVVGQKADRDKKHAPVDAWDYLRRNTEQKKYKEPSDAWAAIRRAKYTKDAEVYSFTSSTAKTESEPYKNHFPIRALSDELREIERVVSGARISRSRHDVLSNPYAPSKQVVRDDEHGIDKILESAPIRRQKIERAIKEYPLSNIRSDEVADINSVIKLYEKKGKISPQLTKHYIREVETSAGVPHEAERTPEEKMRVEGIARSNQVYAVRMARKEKERESYFKGPGIGRDIAEDRGWYRKLKKFFSRA